MIPWNFWFSGPAIAAFIGVVGSLAALAGTGYGWYRAALAEMQSAETKDVAEKQDMITRLTREYVLTQDGIKPGILAGTENVPIDWLNMRLEQMGKSWRVEDAPKK